MYDDDDDDDDELTIKCPSCNAEIYEDSPQCSHCGEYITASNQVAFSSHSKWFRQLITIVIMLTILSFLLPYLFTLIGWFGKE